MQKTRILGLMVFDRIKEAGRTQEVLSRYASIIRTRLGFHELSQEVCSRIGTLILVLHGDETQWDKLEGELQQIGGVEVKHMQFNH